MKKISAVILGSGTCVPSLERKPCSILIQGPSAHLLVDVGPGIMGRLLEAGVHINDIDMILLSHFHLDHCAELAPFLFATKYPGLERTKPLTLLGGVGLVQLLDRLNQAYDHTLELPETLLDVRELEADGQMDTELDGIVLSWATMAHRPESRAYRVTDRTGFSLVYSGDTDMCPELPVLAKGADILICESALPEGHKVPGHLTPTLAGEMAEQAGVKTLILTHFYPECDGRDLRGQCRKAFHGEIRLAEDLMVI